jgi:hypothetical protein
MEEAWAFEHTVEYAVSKEFAWKFWSDVANWRFDADVISTEIYGPFAAGTCGVTVSKSSGKIEWRIAEVEPGHAAIEFPVPGATARFAWNFSENEGETRISQRASISGERAAEYVAVFAPVLEQGIPAGMQKLCEVMRSAAGA